MSGDVGEDFKAWHKHKQAKRASNREVAVQVLFENDIPFESKNGGAHLIVTGKDGLVDFWPGTGKFIVRGGKTGRGVFTLLKLLNARTNERQTT